MGQTQPPTLPPGDDQRVSGNKSALAKDDARFIEFVATITPEEMELFRFKPPHASTYQYATEQGRITVRVDDYILTKIAYERRRGPLAAEEATTTFWKTEENLYFFMIRGGLAVTDRLFGPFQCKGEQFVFAATPQEQQSGRGKADWLQRIRPRLEAEWARLNPNPGGPSGGTPRKWWTYVISPPFPSGWPPTPDATLYYYVYANGHDLSGGLKDGVYIAAPWGRVEVDPRGTGGPKFRRLSERLRQIGIQGVRPLTQEETAVFRKKAAAEAHLATLTSLPDSDEEDVRILREYFCTWCQLNGHVLREIRPAHKQFFQWLGCK